MSSFQHPNLKFLCLGKYLSGIAGEKDKVVCIVKPKILIASVRGNLTQEMALTTVASIHHQDAVNLPSPTPSPVLQSDASNPPSRTGSPSAAPIRTRHVDIVVTDLDGKTMSFTIHKKHLNSFLGVALYYCPPDTPVHEISGSTVPLFDSLTNVTRSSSRGVLASVVGFLQHAGQDNSGQESLQFLKAGDSDDALDTDERPPLMHGAGIVTTGNRESLLEAAARRQKQPVAVSLNVTGITKSLDLVPLDDNLANMLEDYASDHGSPPKLGISDQLDGSPAMVSSKRASQSHDLPKPRASSRSPPRPDEAERRRAIAEDYPSGLEKLARHQDPTTAVDATGAKRHQWSLPGDNELYAWKPQPGRLTLNTNTPASVRFAQGGTSLTLVPRSVQQQPQQLAHQELASREEQGTMISVIKELRTMQGELERLKAESAFRQQIPRSSLLPNAHSNAPAVVDSDDDDVDTCRSRATQQARDGPTVVKLPSSPSRPVERGATVAENARGSLLPLMTFASQHAAMRAIGELQEIQRGLLDAGGSKYLNPAIQRQLEAMEEPLRVLFRIVAPAVTPVMSEAGRLQGPVVPSSISTGEFLPVWALVDFGEVNYDHTPLTLRQYHRIVARRIDEENMSHVMIATRQQFALDEGYIQVPFSSILDVAMGCQPRPICAQRLLMDGTVSRSDELYDCKSCISIKTRLQHIQIQFESVEDCEVWARVMQSVVIMNTKALPQGTPFRPATIASEDL
jgi:hypothetical protein